jgi:hypothetical protein
MNDHAGGPWEPGRGDSIEKAAAHAWENAKNAKHAPGFAAEHAPPGIYRLNIWVETENPIRAYIVTIDPTGP